MNNNQITIVIEALETLKVSGSKDISTMNNIFSYLKTCIDENNTNTEVISNE